MTPEPRLPSWIWADIHDVTYWKNVNPNNLSGRELSHWSKDHFQQLLDEKLSAMDDTMTFGQTMTASANDGQLAFFAGSTCVLDGVYVSEDEAKCILPQWQSKLRDTFVSESMNAKRVLNRLLDLRTTTNEALVNQLNELTTKLYGLEDIHKT